MKAQRNPRRNKEITASKFLRKTQGITQSQKTVKVLQIFENNSQSPSNNKLSSEETKESNKRSNKSSKASAREESKSKVKEDKLKSILKRHAESDSPSYVLKEDKKVEIASTPKALKSASKNKRKSRPTSRKSKQPNPEEIEKYKEEREHFKIQLMNELNEGIVLNKPSDKLSSEELMKYTKDLGNELLKVK